ncbi:MAG: hypothetical protein II642_02600, partial [Firmicutes bacterium]|nr:hypothetical protein [Bacillota bacterium]
LFREMSPLLDSEAAMEKLLKYVRKLAAKKNDPTLMTKEEFFANVDEALEQAQKGQVHRMEPDESLDDFLKRVG